MNDVVFIAIEYCREHPAGIAGVYSSFDKAVKEIKKHVRSFVHDITQETPEEKRYVIKAEDYDDDTLYLENAVTVAPNDEYCYKCLHMEKGYEDEEFETYRYAVMPVVVDNFNDEIYLDYPLRGIKTPRIMDSLPEPEISW